MHLAQRVNSHLTLTRNSSSSSSRLTGVADSGKFSMVLSLAGMALMQLLLVMTPRCWRLMMKKMERQIQHALPVAAWGCLVVGIISKLL